MATEVRDLTGASGGMGGLLRAALPTVPLVNQLPRLRKGGGGLPDLAVRRTGVRLDRDSVSAYAAVCGFARKDVVPVTYLPILPLPGDRHRAPGEQHRVAPTGRDRRIGVRDSTCHEPAYA